jgi:ABC-type uncharacterized transport system auxiliary subunit
MNSKNRIFLLLAAAAIVAGGCLKLNQPRQKVEYYTLEYEPQKLKAIGVIPALIRVERFTAAPQYNTTQMIYREQPFSRDTYHYHKWRAYPADLASYFIARDLGRSGAFKGVLPSGAKTNSTHVLEGSVDEFYERDLPERWDAILTITVSLLREMEPDPTKRLVFQKVYSFAEPSNEKNPRSIAEAMSRAMAKTTSAIIADMRLALSNVH